MAGLYGMLRRTTEYQRFEYDSAFDASVSNEQTLNLPILDIHYVKHSRELRLAMLACHHGN